MWDMLKGFGFALLLGIPLHFLDRCSHEREINARWASKIKAAGGRVTSIIKDADIELEAEDKVALERLDAEQTRRDQELQELQSRRSKIPVSEACDQCRIPAERLRLR